MHSTMERAVEQDRPGADPVRQPRILVADDQDGIVEALRLLLKGSGFLVETARSPSVILETVSGRRLDAVLMDLNYERDTSSGREGLALLDRLKDLDPELPLIVMTAWGSVDLAVEAMRRGARDFIQKPWDNDALLATLREHGGRGVTAHGAHSSTDMRIARSVQRNLLPRAAPRLATLACAGACVEAGEVGGDYYDFIDRGQDRTAIVLADISGKGVPGALLMAHLQASLRSRCARPTEQVATILEEVHRLFLEASAPEHYATLFFGEYDDRTRRLRYVNAGHPPPLLLRGDGAARRLDPTAALLGAMSEWRCRIAETVLVPGETLVIYSDGVPEARNGRGEEFGEARIVSAVRPAGSLQPDRLPGKILRAVRSFAGAGEADDRTIVTAVGL